MEFMSIGVPVVVSSTKIDRYYFDDSVVRFFESGNSDALAEAMLEVFRNADLCKQIVSRGLDYARANSWERRKSDYLRLVDTLLCDTQAQRPGDGVGLELRVSRNSGRVDIKTPAEITICNAVVNGNI
jgi:hypothetical protein